MSLKNGKAQIWIHQTKWQTDSTLECKYIFRQKLEKVVQNNLNGSKMFHVSVFNNIK